MLQHYTMHYIKKSQGKITKYSHLKENFKIWAIANIGYEKYYKYKCLQQLMAYILKNYKSNGDNIFDIEIIDASTYYKPTYNILNHYTEDLKTLNQLKKECHVIIGNKKILLHKYIDSK